MAVVIEAFSIVVRNSTLAGKYSGGLAKYRRDCPNNSFCADEWLSRVGFMARTEADFFVAQLAANGLMPYRKGDAEDVVLATASDGLLHPCTWLELGRWGKAVVAWLAGTKRGNLHAPKNWSADRQVQLASDDVNRRLQFLRSENNVDVYRDEETGQELYVGRTASVLKEANTRHDELYRQGRQLIEGLILLDNRVPAPLDPRQRQRLENAISLFAEVVRINPGNWAAMWYVGKIYQRLEEFEEGLAWYCAPDRLNPEQSDIAREAAIAAMDLGRPEEAIPFCETAIEAKPDDPGLQANLRWRCSFPEKWRRPRPWPVKRLREIPRIKSPLNSHGSSGKFATEGGLVRNTCGTCGEARNEALYAATVTTLKSLRMEQPSCPRTI